MKNGLGTLDDIIYKKAYNVFEELKELNNNKL